MNKLTNVLVYPCGAESGLEIHLALKDIINIRVVGASGKQDHGRMVYKNYYRDFPYVGSPEFIDTLNQLIEKEAIDIILPTHDSVLLFLARNAAKINTRIAFPSLEATEICRSKKKIYDLFQEYDFCPEVYDDIEKIENFPVYAKLDEGQGSKGAFIVKDKKQLTDLEDIENFVVMELLPGVELTIDCFTDRHGRVQFVGPRNRKRVSDGISVNSNSVPATDEIRTIAKIVSDEIGIRGSWYFQLKKDVKGKFKLLEASVKVAGNSNTFRGIGVNLPLLMVYDYLDYDVEVFHNDYGIEVDRCLQSRYNIELEYDTIYIDFDDTITKNKEVNPNVMMFLYHQKQKKRTIKLITKHIHDLDQTLENLAIHKGIFDEIIHLKMEDEKYRYIKEKEKVIFIDNAYGERAKVKKELNIPVFDVDTIPTLIDWRE
ncbi:MAG: ATP-grasp domain-containing protein [Cytophagaceae bacterium]|nr:ATP-grasp domain-containing protein [Cytophagaceae bacterium]